MKLETTMRIALEPTLSSLESPAVDKAEASDSSTGFDDAVARGLEQMEAVTRNADADAEGMIDGEVSLHDAMISMEKANLVLRMGTTVRNKLLDAYRQLSQVAG
jgi:flagellar hook-basal body complex protein FliE